MMKSAEENVADAFGDKTWSEEEITRAKYRGILVQIRSNKIANVASTFSYESRNDSMVCLLNRALSKGRIKDCSLIISTDDFASSIPIPQFSFCKPRVCEKEQRIIPCPDFSFNHWLEAKTPSWDDVLNLTREKSETIPFTQRVPKLLFRGNLNTNPIRQVYHSWSIENPFLFDVKATNCSDEKSMMKIEDHANYRYLWNLPGRSYAGRRKYMFLTSSLVFHCNVGFSEWYDGIFDTPERCVIEHNNKSLKSDMQRLLIYYNENPQEAQKIGALGNHQMRSIKSDVVNQYWLELLQAYSNSF